MKKTIKIFISKEFSDLAGKIGNAFQTGPHVDNLDISALPWTKREEETGVSFVMDVKKKSGDIKFSEIKSSLGAALERRGINGNVGGSERINKPWQFYVS